MDCDFGFESIQKAMDYGENLNGSEREMYQKLLVPCVFCLIIKSSLVLKLMIFEFFTTS